MDVKEKGECRDSRLLTRSGTEAIHFGEIPSIGTQEAINGIRFDFCDGLRVFIPEGEISYRLRFNDLDTSSLVYDVVAPPGSTVVSLKKYFIRFRLVISDPASDRLLFMHDYDARDREVMVRFPVHTLGDSIGWFSYVERFQQKHGCKLICVVSDWFAAIVNKQYPTIRFVSREEAKDFQPYANYNIGLFEVGNVTNQPVDHRYVGLHRLAAHILGVDSADEPPRFDLSAPRRIKEKYVCIGVQSTSLAKHWNHPTGWDETVAYLKQQGFRVLCIDKEAVTGRAGSFQRIPREAEDFTGDKPLQERIDLLKDAEFFIGLSSGLSWLAWGCRIPVVMISGFSAPWNEFATPYRVINYNACNSCWQDCKEFDLADYWYCPRLKDTGRRFECTAMISPRQVIDMIQSMETSQR